MSFARLSCPSAALLVVFVLMGCAPDKGPGTLTVTYVLGNEKTCAELGVDSVRAKLFSGGVERYSDAVSCNDGEVVLESLDPAVYEVEVVAYDDAGVAILDNLGSSVSDRRAEIFEAADSNYAAELDARPSVLKLRWRLGDGGFGNCAGVGIDRFVVEAFQTGGSALLLEDVVDCEETGNAMGYFTIPDPDRVLSGVLFGEAGIQPLDASGGEVGSPTIFIFEPVGAGYPVELTLECSDQGCTGTGTTDP